MDLTEENRSAHFFLFGSHFSIWASKKPPIENFHEMDHTAVIV